MKKLILVLMLLAVPFFSAPAASASDAGPKPAVSSTPSANPEAQPPIGARLIGGGCHGGQHFWLYSYFGYVYAVYDGGPACIYEDYTSYF